MNSIIQSETGKILNKNEKSISDVLDKIYVIEIPKGE